MSGYGGYNYNDPTYEDPRNNEGYSNNGNLDPYDMNHADPHQSYHHHGNVSNDPYHQHQQQQNQYGYQQNQYGYHDPYGMSPMGDVVVTNGRNDDDLDVDGDIDDDDVDDVNILGGVDDEEEGGSSVDDDESAVDFDDPKIANLPRILLMGPRRAGKTSIQRVVFHKMSPHETLFRLDATQNLERSVVDHTPLCRFTIWDFPGDYYGPDLDDSNNHHHHVDSIVEQQQQQMEQQQQQQQQQASLMTRQPPVHSSNHHHQQHPSLNNAYNPQHPMNDVNNMNNNPDANNTNPDMTISKAETTAGGTTTTPDPNNDGNNNTAQDENEAYVFGRATALIFVLDAQDEPYDHVLAHFTETVKRAARANPHIAIEVFINKVDGELFLSDEAKYDCRRDVMQQVSDELADAGVMPDSVPISYHLTSIYDHSVFEAFSRVVQKLIPQLPTLENLLNVLVSTCAMEKAYLFDVASKLYISTDSSPVDMQSVELCSDMIDVVLDVSGIYGLAGDSATEDDEDDGDGDDAGIGGGPVDDEDNNDNDDGLEGDNLDQDGINELGSLPTSGGGDIDSAAAAGTTDMHSFGSSMMMDPSKSNIIDASTDGDGVGGGVITHNNGVIDELDSSAGGGLDYGNDSNDELVGRLISQRSGGGIAGIDEEGDDDENDESKDKEVADSAYDSESASVIRLSKGMVLYLKEVDTMLALVCLTRSDNFRKRNLINYNIGCLKKALKALVKPE